MTTYIDLTGKTGSEIVELLKKNAPKPTPCLFPWERIDPVQARGETRLELVAEYEEVLGEDIDMPSSEGRYVPDLDRVLMTDGIHTANARVNRGATAIPILLRLGTKTDADIDAAGANADHGSRRNNEEKRNAIKLLLRNPELCARSNNWLAEIAKVSPPLVEEVRVELENDPANPIARLKKRRAKRNGAEYEVTSPKRKTAKAKPAPEELVASITGDIAKRLKPYSDTERTAVCQQLVAAIPAMISGL